MEEARDTSKFINAGSDRCENYMNLLIHYVSVRVYEVVILHIFFFQVKFGPTSLLSKKVIHSP